MMVVVEECWCSWRGLGGLVGGIGEVRIFFVEI